MILLDTHTYLWFTTEDARLPAGTRSLIEETEHVYVSAASFWEMAIKASLGKLHVPCPVNEMMEICEKEDFPILGIKPIHIKALETLPFIHGDPFDRLIISQALSEDMTIITRDHIIPQYDVKVLWPS